MSQPAAVASQSEKDITPSLRVSRTGPSRYPRDPRHRQNTDILATFTAALCTTLLVGATTLAAPPAEARAITHKLDIPAQDLGAALKALGAAANEQLLFSDDVVAGLHSPQLKGEYSTDEAITLLLKGSGLKADRTPSGVLLIRAPAASPSTTGKSSFLLHGGEDVPQADQGAPLAPEGRGAGGAGLPSAGEEKKSFWQRFRLAQAETPSSAGEEKQTSEHSSTNPQNRMRVEEVVVTAQKRETNLQDTPVSITAMSGETLRAIGVSNIEDFQLFTPGITITNDSMAIVNIRGIGTSAFGVATDPSSTVHYDGVYIPRPTTGYQDLYDVERVELLRGPQGVLFGRNSAGGTLNIASKAPSREFEAVTGVTIGNFKRRSFSGTVSGPLTERMRGRLTLLTSDRDGIYENPNTGAEYQNLDSRAARASVAMDVTDAFELTLRGDYSRDRETGYPAVRLSYPPEFALAGATIPRGERQLALDTMPKNDVDGGGVSATAVYTTEPLTLKSITAYRSSDVAQVLDVDATDLFLRNIVFDEKSKSFTQEFQVTNNDPGRLEWIAGAFYLNERGEDQIQILEPGRALAIPEENVTDAYALYGQATYALGERDRLTAGLRYSYETKDFQYRIFSGGAEVAADTAKESWNAWTPKLGIQHDISEDVMVYASATRGFKSGGFQLGDGKPFLPEYLWSYEIGLKSMLLDQRLRANLGIFYYDYTDLQVVEYINGVATTTNAGKATLKGGEFEVTARATDSLDLIGTVAYLDAKYDRYFDQGVDLAGNTLPNSPKWNLTLASEYRIELNGGGVIKLRGDVAQRDKIFFKANNLPQFSNDSYVLVNARVAFSTAGDKWEMALYGRNLTDERYATYRTVGTDTTGVSNPNLPLAVFGEPRQYGVQIVRSFE